MNNDHHGALYDQIEADRIHQRGLVLSTVWGAFFDGSIVLGGLRPAPSVSLYSLLILVSFLLYGAPKAGTCPISPSLQLLGVVVRTEKYGRVRRKALNTIMKAFPLNTYVVFSYFSTFPTPWNDGECHYRWQVTPSTLGYTVPRRALLMAEEGLFLPTTEEGFFPWAGPLAQYSHRHGSTGLLPPTIAPQNLVVRLLGRRCGFW